MVAAALCLADERGIAALSMRRLADALGVEAMTLYYHVTNKDDILDALADAVVGEFELPSAEAEWKSAIRTTALSAYDALTRHPWAASLTLSLRRPTPGRLRYMDAILAALSRAGFSESETDRAYHVVEGHIMGFTLWEVGMNLGTPEELKAVASDLLRGLRADDYPHVAEHVAHHLRERDPDEAGSFAFGLELILDGLQRVLAARATLPER